MQRLLKRPQFDAVLAGATVARTAHFALHRCPLDTVDVPVDAEGKVAASGPGSARPQALFAVRAPWLGAMVPKRWARRAVTRNTIKRQIYAVAHACEASLPDAAHVVRLRTGFDRKQFSSATSAPLRQAIRAELQALFARAAGTSGARP